MAKVTSAFKIEGKIGDLVFFIRNGKQHVKLANQQEGKRIKSYEKNDTRVITNNIKTGINYYATGLYRLMKMSGVGTGNAQFNALANHIYYAMKQQLQSRPTLRASEVKKAVHGYTWRNNHLGSKLFVNLTETGFRIENLNPALYDGHRLKTEKFQANVFKRTLEDLTYNGERYVYTLPEEIPAFFQMECDFSAATPFVDIELGEIAENEFVVIGILPVIDECYAVQSGAGVWVF